MQWRRARRKEEEEEEEEEEEGNSFSYFFNARPGWKLAAKRPTAKIRGSTAPQRTRSHCTDTPLGHA